MRCETKTSGNPEPIFRLVMLWHKEREWKPTLGLLKPYIQYANKRPSPAPDENFFSVSSNDILTKTLASIFLFTKSSVIVSYIECITRYSCTDYEAILQNLHSLYFLYLISESQFVCFTWIKITSLFKSVIEWIHSNIPSCHYIAETDCNHFTLLYIIYFLILNENKIWYYNTTFKLC